MRDPRQGLGWIFWNQATYDVVEIYANPRSQKTVRVLQVRPAGCLIRAGTGTGTQKREF